MLGRRVGGYEVKSIVGGGRSGTIYLAVNADTGHRAAVRVLIAADTGGAFTEFAREVAVALQLARVPEVSSRTLDDGREVLFAAVDAGAPGSGVTRFPQTTRLERPVRRRRLVLPISALFLSLLLIGLGWWRRQAEPQPVVVSVPALPAAVAVGVPVVVEPEPVVEAPRPPVLVKREPPSVPRMPCEVTASWRTDRLADLAELQERVVGSESLSAQLQPALDQLSVQIRQARDEGDCRKVEAALRPIVTRLVGH